MSNTTKIEWTNATWNPITGCSVVSPGCTNCYAMQLAGGRLRDHPSRAGLTRPSKAGPVWTGEVRFNEQWLDQPLRWRKPKRIFVCAHGDLFHEDVPDEWIDRIFAVMALAPQHTFQMLTKRPERMRAYSHDTETPEKVFTVTVETPGWQGELVKAAGATVEHLLWPLPNVWLGTSVEDQARADERIPHLLATPAAVRFVSAEPLLGSVDFSRIGLWLCKHWKTKDSLTTAPWCPEDRSKWWWERQALRGPRQEMLDWIIVGGESGPGARPMELAWARSIRDQCREANVPVFIKQLGARPREICTSPKQVPVNLETIGVWVEGMSETRQAKVLSRDGHRYTVEWPLGDPKGGDMAEWPADLHVREYPDG